MVARTASTVRLARSTAPTADDTRQTLGGLSSGGGQLPPDTIPPIITSILASAILDVSATITWTTDEISDTQVEYGTTVSYGSSTSITNTPASTLGVTNHSASLSGLSGTTTYHYRVKSKDRFNNLATSTDYTFVTLAASVIPGMNLSALTTWPNYSTLGVEALFSGDVDKTASVPMQALLTTGVSSGATTLPFSSALPCSLPSGARLLAYNGVIPVLSAPAAIGDTSVTVTALSGAIPGSTPIWVSGLQFKKTADSQWRLGIQPARCDNLGADDGTQRWFSGKIVELDPATSYDVRMTVVRGGVEQTLTATATTRTDSISSHAALLATVTHYVDPVTGDDTTGTGAIGAPWKTLSKVFTAAPLDAVVQLAPGWYPVGNTIIRTTGIKLVAQYPYVTNDTTRAAEVDTSKHSIVYSGFQTAPTGTGADAGYAVAPWTLYTAASGRQAWKWTAPFSNLGLNAACHRLRAGDPDRIPNWSNGTASSIDGMIDIILTNQMCNYGFLQRAGDPDIYLILPPWAVKTSDGTPTTNPNDTWTTFSPRAGSTTGGLIMVGGINSRVSGLLFQGQLWLGHYTIGAVHADNIIVDHCGTWFGGIYVRAADPVANTPTNNSTTNTTIQYNLIRDSRLSDPANPDASHTISWNFAKGSLVLADGSTFGNRLGAGAESRGTIFHRWTRGVVIRNNTLDGVFNGVGVSGNGSNNPVSTQPWKRLFAADVDVHDNVIKHTADDGIEPEQYALRHAYFRNREEYTYSYVSLGPAYGGPHLVYDNQGWRGTPLGNVGTVASGSHRGYKYGNQNSATNTTVWHINNTWWTDATDTAGDGRSHGLSQAYSGTAPVKWRFYNSIIRASFKPAECTGAVGNWQEDYNLWGSSANVGQTNASMDINGTKYYALSTYKSGTSQGVHSNNFGGVNYEPLIWTTNPATGFVDAQLTNATTGVLTRVGGSVLNHAGIPFPNIRDGGNANTPILGTGGNVPDVGHML